MPDTKINLAAGRKADRKLEIHYVNVAPAGATAPEWEILGRGVEDAAMEFNHDVDTTTDILGLSDTEVSPAKPQLDLDPNTVRGGQKLNAILLDMERRNALGELSTFEVLNVHTYLSEGTDAAFLAEKHVGCTIVPQSLGGASYVGMPLNVHLSNDKVLGTATITAGVPTFTPDGAGAGASTGGD